MGHRCWTIEHLAVLQEQAKALSDCQAEELWRGQLACELAEHQHLQGELATLETALEPIYEGPAEASVCRS